MSKPAAFQQVLLWALDMPTLGQAASLRLESAGLQNVRLVWGATSSDAGQWQISGTKEIEVGLNSVQKSLILKARMRGDSAKAAIEHVEFTALLLTSNKHNWACLTFELGVHSAEILKANQLTSDLKNLALRCQSVLQTEHFHLDIQRLAAAERLQRSLFAISDLANSDKETQAVLRELHQIVNGLMYAENFFIARYDPADETIRFIYFVDSVDWNAPNAQEKIDVHSLHIPAKRSHHSEP